jgi:hypothetical protein
LKNVFPLFILTIIISRCALPDHLTRTSDQNPVLTKETLSSYSGRYSNTPDNVIGVSESHEGPLERLTLESALSKYGHNSANQYNNGQVQLDFKSERELIVSVSYDGRISDRFIVRGRVKNGYFYRKKYFLLAPFIPIYFGYSFGHYRIRFTEDHILIDNRSKYWLFFFVAGGSRTLNSTSQFRRI